MELLAPPLPPPHRLEPLLLLPCAIPGSGHRWGERAGMDLGIGHRGGNVTCPPVSLEL